MMVTMRAATKSLVSVSRLYSPPHTKIGSDGNQRE